MKAKLPANEIERLQALYRYRVLDSDPEPDFDGIVQLAAQLCDSPIALITLVDQERQWFKAKIGLNMEQTNRDIAFCSHTIHENDVMMVRDTLNDKRFHDNPLVTDNPNIRFYAGMPLITNEGHKIGSICVIDNKPKELNEKQLMDLRILGKQVINLLDLRIRNLELNLQIQEKTAEVHDVFERITDAFIALDKNWCYLYANKQVGELVKRSPESLIGKNVWEEFPDAVGSQTYYAFHRAMAEQKYICHQDYYAPLDLWQENHIYPSPLGISVFIKDITERKNAEKRLIENLQRLEQAEGQAKLGSWSFAPGTGTGQWSKQLFRMFGFEPADTPPDFEEYLQRVHPEDRSLIEETMASMLAGEEPESKIYRTNPELLPLRYYYPTTRCHRDEAGKPTLFEGTLLDVTERKIAELNLRKQFDELEKTNHELDRFVYSVSHDLRAPLASVLGLINLAEMEQVSTSQKQYLEMIRGSINRLDGFIKDILDYSKNSRMEIQINPVNWHELIHRIYDHYKTMVNDGYVNLNLNIKNHVPAYSDIDRVEVILNNLLSNSFKFHDAGKDGSHIDIHVESTDSQIAITFSDNGIGIEKEHLEKVFNMFYRASERAKGSGLGLYIVKEMVSRLNGTIEIQSEFGKSTTFKIVIPNLAVEKQSA